MQTTHSVERRISSRTTMSVFGVLPADARSAVSLHLIVASLLLLSYSLLAPAFAHGATWPVGGHRLSPSLGFHETYTAGISNKSSYVHSGLDATASAGSQIVSPIAGTVCFTGSVPSGDSSVNGGGAGQTMRGVSIAMDDGRTVTLMPFSDVYVARGARVEEGECLGTLAATGDRSSSKPHLHMGLKRGSTYYDPMTLFGACAADAADAAQETLGAPSAMLAAQPAAGAAQEAEASLPDISRSEQPAAAGETEIEQVPAGSMEAGAARVQDWGSVLEGLREKADVQHAGSASDAVLGQERFGSISSGQVSWDASPAAEDASAIAALEATARKAQEDATAQASELVGGLAQLFAAEPAAYGLACLFAAACTMFAVVFLRTRRAATRAAMERVGGRLKNVLARAGAG